MTESARIAVVTGASGYLGSQISSTLEARGWQVARLARTPRSGDNHAFAYDLATPLSSEVTEILQAADVLVHAAYDLSITRATDIRRVNIEGTRRLLQAAVDAKIRRTLVLSSMSAFDGTTQLYGRAKLEIEAMTERSGGCAIRPGLVYGDHPGGMAAALQNLTKLPIVPVIAGAASLYTVRDLDLMEAIVALAAVDLLPAAMISVAHPTPVSIRDLMVEFSTETGRRRPFIPIPWQVVLGILRTAEIVGVRLPFRADSLLGLVRAAPGMVNSGPLVELSVVVRPFPRRTR